MEDGLVKGRTYKVRLKPLEELMKIAPHLFEDDGSTAHRWISNYLDGTVGVTTFDGREGEVLSVQWTSDGDSWTYTPSRLKFLGEV